MSLTSKFWHPSLKFMVELCAKEKIVFKYFFGVVFSEIEGKKLKDRKQINPRILIFVCPSMFYDDFLSTF